MLLQKLEKKKLIQKERNRKRWIVELTSDTDSLQKDFQLAQEDYQTIRFQGFTKEEYGQYQKLTEKMKEYTIEYFVRSMPLL